MRGIATKGLVVARPQLATFVLGVLLTLALIASILGSTQIQITALAIGASALLFLLPVWALVILVFPLMVASDYLQLVPPLLAVGEAEIRAYDPLIVLAAVKVLFSRILTRRVIQVHGGLIVPILLFCATLVTATMVAYIRFGPAIFARESISLLRFLSQVLLFFLIVGSIRTGSELLRSAKLLSVLGYLVATSVYVQFVLLQMGIQVGNVYSVYGSPLRLTGVIGDPGQIVIFLLFFVYRHLLLARGSLLHLAGSAFLLGSCFLTGSRGPLLAGIIGVLILFFLAYRRDGLKVRWACVLLLVLTILFAVLDTGAIRTRFMSTELLSFGLGQRLTSMGIAARVFIDHPVFGAGFSGLPLVAEQYRPEVAFRKSIGYYSPVFTSTAYNQYLQILVNAGLLGLAAFLWFLFRSLRVLKNATNLAPEPLKSFLGAGYFWLLMLLLGLHTDCWLLPTSPGGYLLWVVIGLASSTLSLYQTKLAPGAAGQPNLRPSYAEHE